MKTLQSIAAAASIAVLGLLGTASTIQAGIITITFDGKVGNDYNYTMSSVDTIGAVSAIYMGNVGGITNGFTTSGGSGGAWDFLPTSFVSDPTNNFANFNVSFSPLPAGGYDFTLQSYQPLSTNTGYYNSQNSYDGSQNNGAAISGGPVPVPEPSSVGLYAVALGAVALLVYRRKIA